MTATLHTQNGAYASAPTSLEAALGVEAGPPDGTNGNPDGERLPARVDVAVVGGGLAGLAAAATAARAGRSVALFEQASRAGGRARTRTDRGFSFNIGPHALYQGGASLRLLRDLGVEVRAAKVGAGGGTFAVKHGQLHALPFGVRSLLTSRLLDWRAKLEVGTFLAKLGRLDPRSLDGLTVEAWLGQALRTPGARDLVAALIRTASYADDQTRLSAGAGLRQLKTALTGALYVHGGWQTIVDDLRARAASLGVGVFSGTRAQDIETDGADGAVRAVRLADGRRVEAGAVILAAPPRQASALVHAGRQAGLAGWAERAVPVRAACLDVGLRRLPRPDAWFALGMDRPLYLSVHSNWARLAPEGGALVHVLRYLGPSPRAAGDEQELEGLLDLVQPGWRDEVVTRRFLPEIVVAGALPSVAWEQRDGPRGPAVPGIENLYVAGDWVGPDGMLADRALSSGARAGLAAAEQSARLTGTTLRRGSAGGVMMSAEEVA